MGAVCVHRGLCRGAGAERLSVGDCVCMQEGGCGSVCGAVVWPCRGLLLCVQSLCVRVRGCLDAWAVGRWVEGCVSCWRMN